MKFLKDFNIECNKTKIADVFKKTAVNSKELLFEDFKSSLWRILEIRDSDEIDKLNKRLKEIRKIQKDRSNRNKEPELNSQASKEKNDISKHEEKLEDNHKEYSDDKVHSDDKEHSDDKKNKNYKNESFEQESVFTYYDSSFAIFNKTKNNFKSSFFNFK